MDGWAVNGPGPWTVTQTISAGQFPDWELGINEASSIATGAPIPPGTTGIIRSENGTLEGNQLTSHQPPTRDIRYRGEECRTGDLMLTAGSRLTPSAIGLLAATGHDSLWVRLKPRVHVLVFGDELVFDGLPHEGKIRDSLGPQLSGWIGRLGAVITEMSYCPDSLADVIEIMSTITADIVITTGGTAAGPRDLLRTALDHFNARIYVDGVHVRPGHPMMLACIPSLGPHPIPLIGLPGNPLSAIVGLLTLAQPLIYAALGVPLPQLEKLTTHSDLYTKDGTRLIAGVANSGIFNVSEFNGSAMLRGLSHSTGFAVIDRNAAAGDTVQYLALPHN
jgi:molybdopterin molybdotransferase